MNFPTIPVQGATGYEEMTIPAGASDVVLTAQSGHQGAIIDNHSSDQRLYWIATGENFGARTGIGINPLQNHEFWSHEHLDQVRFRNPGPNPITVGIHYFTSNPFA